MQQIIVYRSPGEALFWQTITDGSAFPFMVGILVFFLMIVLLNKVFIEKASWGKKKAVTNVSLALSAIIGCSVIYYMI